MTVSVDTLVKSVEGWVVEISSKDTNDPILVEESGTSSDENSKDIAESSEIRFDLSI